MPSLSELNPKDPQALLLEAATHTRRAVETTDKDDLKAAEAALVDVDDAQRIVFERELDLPRDLIAVDEATKLLFDEAHTHPERTEYTTTAPDGQMITIGIEHRGINGPDYNPAERSGASLVWNAKYIKPTSVPGSVFSDQYQQTGSVRLVNNDTRGAAPEVYDLRLRKGKFDKASLKDSTDRRKIGMLARTILASAQAPKTQ